MKKEFNEPEIFEDKDVLEIDNEGLLPESVRTLMKVEDRDIKTKLEKFKVSNKEQYELACEYGTANARVLKRIEDERKKITQPINLSLKAINDLFKKFSSHFKQYDTIIRKGMLQYQSSVKKREPIQNVNTETGRATIQERWDFKIESERDIPREYMIPDTVKIRRAVIAEITIPGVRAFKKKSTTFVS